MSKERRLELINTIEEKRESYVLAYVTSDRPNAPPAGILSDAVREIYNLLRQLKPFERERLDLFLYSRGGDSNVPWQIVSTIRELFNEFNVLIPYRAHSAATMIALGADAIIMGEKAELSPIDITIFKGPHVPKDPDTKQYLPISVEDVKGFFSLLERYGKVKDERIIDAVLQLMNHVSPLALGHVLRALEQTQLVGIRILESRQEPFAEEVNKEVVNKISAEIFSHHHSISRKEAIDHIKLEQVKHAEDLEDTMWELLTLYESELRINEPFRPEDIMEQSDEDERTFNDNKYVYLETVKATRVLKGDIKVKKIRQQPPQMQFAPKIDLPQIQFPQGIQLNQQAILGFIQQWLQQILPGIIDASLEQYRKQFPVAAYHRTELNKAWVDE